MKIACYSLILGKGYTIPAAVEALARLGYAGIEWRVRDDFHLPLAGLEEKALEAKALCDKAGLATPALSSYVPAGESESVALLLRVAAKISCPMVRVLVPQYDGSVPYAALLTQARRELSLLEPVCRETGVKALVTLHMHSITPSASAALRLVESFSPECIGVIFDPGNMVCEGSENWKMGIELLGPYLAHVHVKNAGWYYSEEEGWRFGWAPLSGGIVDWARVIAALAESGYRGWLSVEDFADLPVEQKLEEDLALLRTYLEAAAPPPPA